MAEVFYFVKEMIEMTVNATNGLIRADGEWPDCSLKDPISIVVLNLMPTRKTTELQFLSRFDDCQFDVQLTFMYPATHHFNGAPRKLIEKKLCQPDANLPPAV